VALSGGHGRSEHGVHAGNVGRSAVDEARARIEALRRGQRREAQRHDGLRPGDIHAFLWAQEQRVGLRVPGKPGLQIAQQHVRSGGFGLRRRLYLRRVRRKLQLHNAVRPEQRIRGILRLEPLHRAVLQNERGGERRCSARERKQLHIDLGVPAHRERLSPALKRPAELPVDAEHAGRAALDIEHPTHGNPPSRHVYERAKANRRTDERKAGAFPERESSLPFYIQRSVKRFGEGARRGREKRVWRAKRRQAAWSRLEWSPSAPLRPAFSGLLRGRWGISSPKPLA